MNSPRPNTETPLTILLLNEAMGMGIVGVGALGSVFIVVKRQFLPVFAPLFGNAAYIPGTGGK